ncbi:MAG: hypothetical protein WAM28_03715 [Chlamydiales bacterium]
MFAQLRAAMITPMRKFIDTIRGSEEVSLNTEDYKIHPMKLEAQQHCERLLEDIQELKSTISKIRQFIAEHPRLNATCERYIREHPEGIVPVKKPQLEGLDYNKIYDRELILGLKRNAYAAELEEIKLFIQRHAEVYACFKEHLEKSEADWSRRKILLLEN